MSVIAKSRIEFFDHLRALAICFVVIVHYRYAALPGGSIGVSVFFCLSGFLITTILLNDDTLRLSSVWRFLLRRFLRVYPAFLCVLLLSCGLMWLTDSQYLSDFLAALPGLATFTSIPEKWLGMGVGVIWTLHVEFWFYISMPFLILLAGRGVVLQRIVFCLIGISLAMKFLPLAFGYTLPRLSCLSFLRWMDNLLYGAVISILAYRRLIYVPARFQPFLSVGALAAIVSIAYFVPNSDRGLVWFVESSLASILTAVLIAVYVASQRAVHSPVIAWLGRISYSVYLVHAIPLDYAQLIWSGRGTTFVLLTLTLLFSVALHYLVEKPGIALGRRLTADAPHSARMIGKTTRELTRRTP